MQHRKHLTCMQPWMRWQAGQASGLNGGSALSWKVLQTMLLRRWLNLLLPLVRQQTLSSRFDAFLACVPQLLLARGCCRCL